MRTAFIQELAELAETHDNIALVVGDLGYSVIEPFAARFPDRFVNAGVAEQNMAGLSAGMASEGYHVFTYSIANFPTFRCAEQLRNDVDYHKLAVTTVAVGAGLSYGPLGYSHHGVQDYALMRTMPNMLIAAPGDPLEARACLRYLIDNPQPSYLRLGKAGEPVFHAEIPDVAPGRWLTVGEPADDAELAFLSTGTALAAASGRRAAQDPPAALYSLPLWGMAHKSGQAEQVSRHPRIMTVEDHLPDAGFGSWLLESLSGERELRSRVDSIALSAEVCGMVGSQAALHRAGGLTLDVPA